MPHHGRCLCARAGRHDRHGSEPPASRAGGFRLETGASGSAQAASTGGAQFCQSPQQLIQQSAPFAALVSSLAPGKAGIIPESFGYQVVLVRSRTVIPFDATVAAVINVVSLGAGISATSWPVQGDANSTGLTTILKSAKVQVNPAYGSWTTALPAPPYIPQVWPAGESAP